MARNVLVDAGFVVALLSRRDAHHQWAVTQASELPPPWSTCEAVLSEAFHLLGKLGTPNLGALLRRGALLVAFTLTENVEPVVKLIEKYSNVPMGDRKSTRLNSSHRCISYAVFCLKKKKKKN